MDGVDVRTWLQQDNDLQDGGRAEAGTCEEDQKLFRALLILELARGERASIDTIELILRRLELRPTPGGMMLIQMDALTDATHSPDKGAAVVLHSWIRRALRKVLSSYPASVLGAVAEDRVVVLVSSGPGSVLSIGTLRNIAENLCQSARRSNVGTLTVGLGSIRRTAYDLTRSYQEAKEALAYQIFLDNDRVIDCNQAPAEINVTLTKPRCFPINEERKMRERIIAGDREGALQACDNILNSLRCVPGLTPSVFKSYILQLVVMSCRSAARISADADAFAVNLQHAQAIRETDSYPSLRNYLRTIIDELANAVVGRRRIPSSEVVIQAKSLSQK